MEVGLGQVVISDHVGWGGDGGGQLGEVGMGQVVISGHVGWAGEMVGAR